MSQVQTLESLKKSHEEYRTLYHKEKISCSQLQAQLSQCEQAALAAREELHQMSEARTLAIQQRDALRQEKVDLEEMMGVGGREALPHALNKVWCLSGSQSSSQTAGIILGCEIERFSYTVQRNLIEFNSLREYFL